MSSMKAIGTTKKPPSQPPPGSSRSSGASPRRSDCISPPGPPATGSSGAEDGLEEVVPLGLFRLAQLLVRVGAGRLLCGGNNRRGHRLERVGPLGGAVIARRLRVLENLRLAA